MNKKEITEFFNTCAPFWDSEIIRDDIVISRILDVAGVCAGKSVLDVACGTGILIPYYLSRNVSSVTGADISPEMIRIAENKFSDPRITFLCTDVEQFTSPEKYDCIVVYNAFPHFPNPIDMISSLSRVLKPEGRLTIAHGMSRERINQHHLSVMHISRELIPAEELSMLFTSCGLKADSIISDNRMYLVSGTSSV